MRGGRCARALGAALAAATSGAPGRTRSEVPATVHGETPRGRLAARTPTRRSGTAVALLLAAGVLVCGCGPPPSERSEPSSAEKEPPDTARIVCDRDGTRVLTPKVAAQRDGVHFEVDNRMRADTSYSVETPEGGGMGNNAPRGESEHVGDFPPGEVRIGCEKPPVDGMGTDYASLSISRGDSGYKSLELECPDGQGVTGMMGSFAADGKGEKGDPVELARRDFSDRIRRGDVVELAGYPNSADGRFVRVVRDGRVIASADYLRAEGGWIQESHTACEGF